VQPGIRARQPSLQHTQDQVRAWQQQRGWVQKDGWQGNSSWRQNRAHNWANQHQTWGQRGGYGGYYIPQSLFFRSFGSSHFFRMMSRPTIFWDILGSSTAASFSCSSIHRPSTGLKTGMPPTIFMSIMTLYNRRYPGAGLAITVVL
jgi:hypothetical protein